MNKLWGYLGFSVLVGCYIITLWTFGVAYLDPSKSVIVYTNNYGEATFELILLLVTFPMVCYVIVGLFMKTRKDEKLV